MNAAFIETRLRHRFRGAGHYGVYAANRLPLRVNYPCMVIVNTDVDGQPGTHWCAIYIDRNGVGSYFDSFGRLPQYYNHHHLSFMLRNTRIWTYNTVNVQDLFSSVCGHYCLTYLLFRYYGYTCHEFIRMFNKNNLLENDKLVKSLFSKYFM